MWEIIKKNKQKSIIALSIMAVWYSLIYGAICSFIILYILYAKNNHPEYVPFSFSDIYIFGVTIALVIFIHKFWSIKNKPYEISGYDIYKVDRYKHKQLYNIVEEIGIASGSQIQPSLYIWDSSVLNAYACGFSPKHSSIVVSKGLLEVLSRDELQGVIAHEMSHIINRDTMYLLCSGALYNISASFTQIFLSGSRSRGKAAGLMLLLALLSMLGQGICFILFMFISRKREYIADACASVYTRYPKGLADALLKIEQRYSVADDFIYDETDTDNLVKASFIVPSNESDSLSSTHPSTQNRVKILLNMSTADFRAYEKEFKKLNKEHIIPKNVVIKSKPIPLKESDNNILPNAAVMAACALDRKISNDIQIKTLQENKQILDDNIKKHRQVDDLVRDLAGYYIIDCSCGTKLKIPPVYRGETIICPHCRKNHVFKLSMPEQIS